METAERGALNTRAEMVEAGWRLLDRVSIAAALGSLSAAEVAAEAGRSERTFWNHFGSWSDYLAALMESVPRRGPMVPDAEYGPVDAVRAALDGGDPAMFPALVRAAASANWSEVTRPEELRAFRRQLLFASRVGADPDVGRMLAEDYYGAYLPALVEIYEATTQVMGVSPLEPLTIEQVARVLAALSEGMLLQHLAEPGSIDDQLAADATTLVALSLLTSDTAPESVAQREDAFGLQLRPVAIDAELLEVASRCRDAFVREGAGVRWSCLAAVSGVNGAVLRRRFQRTSVVGALAFAVHLDGLAPPLRPGEHPSSIGVEWVCRLVRQVRADRVCAQALLVERLDPRDGAAIRTLVPLGGRLAGEMGEPTRPIHDRMVNVALSAALSDDSTSPAHVAEVAMATHPAHASAR